MNDKIYLSRRTEYLLQKAIDAEIQRIKELTEHGIKDLTKHGPETNDIDNCCTEIGVLVALKNQAKDLIEKL